MVLHELLGLPEREKHVVSLCGGGGKTTLMYALARETKTILPTALFTTTHIMTPSDADVVLSVPFSAEECRAAWREGKIASSGTFLSEERKFGAPGEDAMRFLCREASAVIIEADGARRLPVKFPAALAKNTVDLSGGSLTEKQMAELLWAGYGRFDPIFFINQADTSDLAQRGERICAMLRDFGARRAVTASLHALRKSYERG